MKNDYNLRSVVQQAFYQSLEWMDGEDEIEVCWTEYCTEWVEVNQRQEVEESG